MDPPRVRRDRPAHRRVGHDLCRRAQRRRGRSWPGLGLTCDLVIASERAVIVPAFGRLGLIPEVGTSWALTRRLGYQGALAYYLRGDHIDARTALRLCLVQQAVQHYRLRAGADEWCSRIAELPPHAAAMTKPLLRAAADADWNDALTFEEFAEPTCFTTARLPSAC